MRLSDLVNAKERVFYGKDILGSPVLDFDKLGDTTFMIYPGVHPEKEDEPVTFELIETGRTLNSASRLRLTFNNKESVEDFLYELSVTGEKLITDILDRDEYHHNEDYTYKYEYIESPKNSIHLYITRLEKEELNNN